ncbi:MAG: molybdate ABC transporter substrate-binding protein [Planctomycetota bacterium]
MRMPSAMLCTALAATLSVGCRRATAPAAAAMVFASASLTAPFRELVREFERRRPGRAVDLHFAGTPQLVMQVREGAPADVFAAADDASMRRVVDTGWVASAPVPFAGNRLTIVVAKGNPRHIGGLADLARQGLRVVLCGPEVPAGRYARQALSRAGVTVESVSDEPSVKAVVTKVALGEVDAGIVYATDVTDAVGEVVAVPIPEASNVRATYEIALLSGGHARADGAAFLAFVTSADGRAILGRFGFAGP